VTGDEARERFASARVARLATAGADGRPHVVPVVFALAGDTIVHAVDEKPKRTRALRRLANIAANPHVALLADDYDDAAWDRLWWVRADGVARVLEPGGDEALRALALLAQRYAQYRAVPPAGPVVAVDVTRWRGWSAAG
jgi:PPOX class probable F420-dependent enzyme